MTLPTDPILVVDDSQANRDLLCRRLRRRGYAVAEASSGSECLEYLQTQPASLVLLDLVMPGVSGLDVLRSIRATWPAARLPVIIVTARNASEDIVGALDLDADDYITKPIDFAVALARIRTQLARKDAEDRLRASEERYALAARGARDGLWDWDLVAGSLHFSDQWKAIIGCDDMAFGDDLSSWLDRVHPDDRPQLQRDLEAHLKGQAPHFENEHRIRHQSGDFVWVLSRGLAIRDEWGRAARMAGSQSQMAAGKVVDSLTGLPNRVLLIDRLTRLMRLRNTSDRAEFALLFMDLDHFKPVNDELGHQAGDELLQAVAGRLEHAVRPTDVVARQAPATIPARDEITTARLAGDEFTVLLHGVDAGLAMRVAERIQHALSAPFDIRGHEVRVSASIGIAVSTTGYATPDEVLRDADAAMYRAKARGPGQIEVFEHGVPVKVGDG